MNNHQFLSVRCHRLSIRLPKRGRVRPTRVVGEIISIHISSPPQKYPAMVVGVVRPGSDMATGTLRGERKLRSRRVLRISEVFLGRVPPLNCVLFAQAELKWKSESDQLMYIGSIALYCYSLKLDRGIVVKSKWLDFAHFSAKYHFLVCTVVKLQVFGQKNNIWTLVIQNIGHFFLKKTGIDWESWNSSHLQVKPSTKNNQETIFFSVELFIVKMECEISKCWHQYFYCHIIFYKGNSRQN